MFKFYYFLINDCFDDKCQLKHFNFFCEDNYVLIRYLLRYLFYYLVNILTRLNE